MSFTLDTDNPKDTSSKEVLKAGRKNEAENRLTDKEFKILNFVEEHFWRTGEISSRERIREQFPSLTQLEVFNFYKNPDVIEAMEKRSLHVDFIKEDSTGLTAEQLLVANMVLNIEDPTSLRQKLKIAGVSMQKYNAWMRDSVFSSYLRQRAEAVFNNSDADAYLGLVKAVQDQDMAAIKFYFELRGIYNPRLQVDVNIQSVMVQVVEVITKHIDDKQKILDIAADLESLT